MRKMAVVLTYLPEQEPEQGVCSRDCPWSSAGRITNISYFLQPAALTTFIQRSAQFLCAACAPRHKTQNIASFAHSQPSSCKRLRVVVYTICLRVGCRLRVQCVLLVRSGATPKLFSNNSDTHDCVTIADSCCLSITTPVAADDQCRTHHTHGAVRCQRLSGMGRRARLRVWEKKERRAVLLCCMHVHDQLLHLVCSAP